MAVPKILLPFNFAPLDQKALGFVNSTFGHIEGVGITVFHAYTPLPEIVAEDTSVMGKLKGDLMYLGQKIMQQEAELAAVKENLIEGGFAPGCINTVFKPRKKDIASEIIEFTGKDKFNVLVISHRPGKASRFFTGSVFNKVVAALKDITVCIVS